MNKNTFYIEKNSPIPKLHSHMWTGIGSQSTPLVFKFFMAAISYVLAKKGFGLRSGRARGADNFFELGVPNFMKNHAEIYLPQKNFGINTGCRSFFITDGAELMEAMYLIDKNNIHENWQDLMNSRGNSFAVAAHTRNVFQCLGFVYRGIQLSKFVICWTRCGATNTRETTQFSGGTRTAIRIADHYNIPVYNLARREHCMRLYKMVIEESKRSTIPFNIPSFSELEVFLLD